MGQPAIIRRRFRTACAGLVLLMIGCDYWPQKLPAIAETVAQQTSGQVSAWRVGGDVLVISVARSPLFDADNLEGTATQVANRALARAPEGIGSIAITFYEQDASDTPEQAREFVYVVQDGGAVLQPNLALDASGPITLAELQAYHPDALGADAIEQRCRTEAFAERTRAAGDPETLEPDDVEFLSGDHWWLLDSRDKRLLVMQALALQILFDCQGSATTDVAAIGPQRRQPATRVWQRP